MSWCPRVSKQEKEEMEIQLKLELKVVTAFVHISGCSSLIGRICLFACKKLGGKKLSLIQKLNATISSSEITQLVWTAALRIGKSKMFCFVFCFFTHNICISSDISSLLNCVPKEMHELRQCMHSILLTKGFWWLASCFSTANKEGTVYQQKANY